MAETETKPVIRVRINHKRTEKRGWECSETTVEYTSDLLDWQSIQHELRMAHGVGEAEAVARNNAIAANADG